MHQREILARQAKVDALVATIGGDVLRVVREMDEALWANTASRAEIKLPSEITRRMVIAELERRVGAANEGGQ